jgi:hypothetical protein
VIDQALLTEIQYALLEPPDGGQSWPSEVWTRDEVIGNVNSNIWNWLRDTHAIVTRVELPQLAVALGVVALPADWLATCSVVWRTAGGVRTPLGPMDRFEGDLALPTWEDTGGVPLGLDEFEADTLTAQLIPIPLVDGVLELLYVARTTAVNGAGITLPIPEEFVSAAKYGALAMLLRKVGRLVDPERATYCERRYDLTVLLTKILLGGWA